MRLTSFSLFAAAIIFSGCANEGTVIDKRAGASPFTYSLGIDGVFKLILRDQQGNVRSQLVTPDVFNRYEVGDYFNDLQPGPTRRETKVDTSKEVQPVIHRKPHHRRRHQTTNRKSKQHHRAVLKHRNKIAPQPALEVMRKPSPESRG